MRAALAFLLVLAACDGGAATTPDAAVADAPLAPAVTATPRTYVGVVTAAGTVDLAPQLTGKLLELKVHPGDVVPAGEVVAIVDDQQVREALAMATAELRAAQANVSQAAAEARAAEHSLRSEQSLYSQGFSAGGSLESARASSNEKRASVASAAAMVGEREARIASLRRQIGDTTLRAPFAGRVSVELAQVGETVGPDRPVVRLIDSSVLLVRFAAPPEDVRLLNPGDAVRVRVDGRADELGATIQQIAPEVDPPTGLVFCVARLDVGADASIPPRSPAWVRRVDDAGEQSLALARAMAPPGVALGRATAPAAPAVTPLPTDAGVPIPDAAPIADAAPPDAAPTPAPEPAAAPPPPVAERAPERAKKPRPERRRAPTGLIAVGARPPMSIRLDGDDTGLRTPQRGIRVSAGRHTIELVDGRGRVRAKKRVTVRAGETARVVENLEN